jgi:heme exporter protein C
VGLAAVAALVAGLYLALWASPPDAFQGDYVRLMYVHVPSAWVAYLAVAVAAVASLLYLWRRRPAYDHVAQGAAELVVLFTGLALATGMIWGRPVWGVWWTWDARLVSTAILFLVYVGCLLVRGLAADRERGARLAAVVALVGALDVPIIHFSVLWFRTLHQTASITRREVSMAPAMLAALLVNLLAFALLFLYLVALRARLARLEAERAEAALEPLAR